MWVDQLAYCNNKKYPLQTHVHTTTKRRREFLMQFIISSQKIYTVYITSVYRLVDNGRGEKVAQR